MGRIPRNWDALTERVWEFYNQFGKVNGVGWTKGKNGKHSFAKDATDAIGVYFETMNANVTDIPREFEGYQVIAQVIGEIRAQ